MIRRPPRCNKTPVARLTSILLIGCTVVLSAPMANAANCPPGNRGDTVRQTTPAAQAALANAVVLFDARRYALSAESAKTALTAGLHDPQERSLAHKYLAFNYCLHGSIPLCEREFELAFEARADFSLANHEASEPAWRDAYQRAADRLRLATCSSPANVTANWGPSALTPRLTRSGQEPYPGNDSGRGTQLLTVDTGKQVAAPVSAGISLPSSYLPLGGNVEASIDPPTTPRYETRNSTVIPDTPRTNGGPAPYPPGAPTTRYRQDQAVTASGLLRLRVQPWASVRINGRPIGATPPLTELPLEAGAHVIEFSNGNHPAVRQNLQVYAGETVTITYDFEAR